MNYQLILLDKTTHLSDEPQKFVRGDRQGTAFFAKKPIKSAKTHFFRIFSIFAFRCMVKLPLIGAEIAPAIAIKFSGLV